MSANKSKGSSLFYMHTSCMGSVECKSSTLLLGSQKRLVEAYLRTIEFGSC